MRWKQKQLPNYGARRIVKRFLLFPKRLDYEWRWLEQAKIQQRCGYVARFYEVAATRHGWIDEHWIDERK